MLAPQNDETSFDDGSSRVGLRDREGLNWIIILGAWLIWNHCNRCAFDGMSPNLAGALFLTCEEMRFWSLARA